jgi:hypothetical protein
MLGMSVALVGTIDVSVLLAGSRVMAQIPNPVMLAQTLEGTGSYPHRYSAATYWLYTGMSSSMTASPCTQALQYVSLRLAS